jgi:D-beta-D-heptose 7-phosphate kinase/D-beta-D-heptose 1-phosphate adenosyltransferase
LAVVSQEDLILQRQAWKRNGLKVVCAAGAFDLLHPGHVRLLEQARALGDRLIVVVLSDEAIRAECERVTAGSSVGRPVNPSDERAEVVADLVAVDAAAIGEGELAACLAALAPDVYAFSGVADSDFPPPESFATERDWAADAKLVKIPIEPGYSTALLIEKIQQPQA